MDDNAIRHPILEVPAPVPVKRKRGRPRREDRPPPPPAKEEPKLYDFCSINEAARRLKVSRATIMAMIKSGELPCIRLTERRQRVNFQAIVNKVLG
jgi:excisionase family DNA binding protein